MTFDLLWHYQISVLVAVAILEECCRASADRQWLFFSGEQIVAHGPLVSLIIIKHQLHLPLMTDNRKEFS